MSASNRKTIVPFPYGHVVGIDTRRDMDKLCDRWLALQRARKSLERQERRALRRYQAAIAAGVERRRNAAGGAK
jgi:hypothetical protein